MINLLSQNCQLISKQYLVVIYRFYNQCVQSIWKLRFFYAISYTVDAPLVYSVLTKYSNPKYLAILVSIALIPISLYTMTFAIVKHGFGSVEDGFYNNPVQGLKFGTISMVVIAIGLALYLLLKKKESGDPRNI